MIDPQRDFGWLAELEKDLALDIRPRSKADRLILTDVLVECGLTLMAEAEQFKAVSQLEQARQYRNELMVALLALHPIRLKNFAGLAIGRTIKEIDGHWWIVLSANDTKENRADERQIDQILTGFLDRYFHFYRPLLASGTTRSDALWLSSNTGLPMAYDSVARAITETTRSTLGVKVSPHMFRTSAASSAAVHAHQNPHLGSAILHRRDPRITEKNYNRATSLSAGAEYGRILKHGLVRR